METLHRELATHITLSPAEARVCELVATMRYESSRAAGVVDKRIEPGSRMLDLDGFGAELAFCKRYNLYPDLSVTVKKGGFDAKTHKGTTVDIKQTRYINGRLVAARWKELGQSDIYVLVTGSMPEYELKGWVPEEELLKPENLQDLGHGLGYVMEQYKLKPFK